MWQIIDNLGIVFSGSEEEMYTKWNQIIHNPQDYEWTGDLKLIQVYKIFR